VNLTSEQRVGAIINAASALIALAALGVGIFRSASARCMKPGFLPSIGPMSEKRTTARAFHDAVGVEDWRVGGPANHATALRDA
jgi:hypothetical protein